MLVKKGGYMFRTLKAVFIPVLFTAVVASGAELLNDDFSDPSVSRDLWLQNLPEEMMTVTVDGGSCQIVNSSEYSSHYMHSFSDPKPSTFTLSFVLESTSAEGNAGVVFCKQGTEDALNGYYVTVIEEQVVVYKCENSSAENIFQEKSFDFVSGENKIMISKDGAVFNAFVNDAFVGTFTDENGYSYGDVAFSVSGNTEAVFGSFLMTDQFTEGSVPTSFHDDFEDDTIKRWLRLEDKASVEENGGVLNVTTASEANLWMYTELALENFEARVEVSHKAGSSTASYGLILLGDGSPVPMVYFGIRGDRRFYVAQAQENFSPALSAAVNGASDNGTDFYVDTLEIRKSADTDIYEFLVNGVSLEEYTNVSFDITGVGLFADPDLELEFDNFSAAQTGTSPVGREMRVQNPSVIRNRGLRGTFDLLGRKAAPVSGRSFGKSRAAGVYVNDRGRNIRIRSREVER